MRSLRSRRITQLIEFCSEPYNVQWGLFRRRAYLNALTEK